MINNSKKKKRKVQKILPSRSWRADWWWFTSVFFGLRKLFLQIHPHYSQIWGWFPWTGTGIQTLSWYKRSARWGQNKTYSASIFHARFGSDLGYLWWGCKVVGCCFQWLWDSLQNSRISGWLSRTGGIRYSSKWHWAVSSNRGKRLPGAGPTSHIKTKVNHQFIYIYICSCSYIYWFLENERGSAALSESLAQVVGGIRAFFVLCKFFLFKKKEREKYKQIYL